MIQLHQPDDPIRLRLITDRLSIYMLTTGFINQSKKIANKELLKKLKKLLFKRSDTNIFIRILEIKYLFPEVFEYKYPYVYLPSKRDKALVIIEKWSETEFT